MHVRDMTAIARYMIRHSDEVCLSLFHVYAGYIRQSRLNFYPSAPGILWARAISRLLSAQAASSGLFVAFIFLFFCMRLLCLYSAPKRLAKISIRCSWRNSGWARFSPFRWLSLPASLWFLLLSTGFAVSPFASVFLPFLAPLRWLLPFLRLLFPCFAFSYCFTVRVCSFFSPESAVGGWKKTPPFESWPGTMPFINPAVKIFSHEAPFPDPDYYWFWCISRWCAIFFARGYVALCFAS